MAGKDNDQAAPTGERKQDFTQLVDGMPFAVFALDGTGVVTYGNAALTDLFGCDRSYLLGKRWVELLEPAAERGWLEFTAKLLTGEQISAKFWLAAAESKRREVRIICQLGYQDRRVSGIQGVVQPVQDKAPARKLGEPMFDAELRSREMKVVRRLADGFVVEMKSVLSSVIGLASVLETEFPEDSLPRRDVEQILAAARTGLDLSRNLLGISSARLARREPFSLNELVGKLAALWERTKHDQVTVEARLGATGVVNGDASQINRIMVNLGVNAIEAMSSGGILTFATEDLTITKKESPGISFSGLDPGEYVVLRVSDTGEGMDDETLSQAFEPFFTTKPTRVSSGLGLSIVFQVVKQHGGQIRVYSKRGLGTTVSMYLPAFDGTVVHPDSPRQKVESASAKNLTILLVDDEVHILRVGQRLLEKLGHNVLTASSGAEAIECYAKQPDEISLVVLDLMLIDMDGAQVLRRIKELDPDARVVICTAMGYDESDPEFSTLGADGLLSKPVDLRRLSAAIEQHARTGIPRRAPD